MQRVNYAALLFSTAILSHAGFADRVTVVNENFDSLAFGDTTGINSSITDGIYDAGLRLRNHLVGEVVAPHANFTSASGQAFQLTTGTNPTGGWGQLSADNSPRSVDLIEGENIVLSFDMYVQAVPEGTSSINLTLSLTGGDNASRAFSEFTGASVGDVIHVSWTVPVSAGMATATAISPVIDFEGHQDNFSTLGPNGDGTDLQIGQIDNLVLEVPVNVPSYYLDADGGSDSNSGTSPSAAWATLSKASSHTFVPGDRLLLQRGDTFNGKLVLNDENGTAALPIVVGAYGTGNRPVIDAAGYLAGIHITSCDYITVRDLEITGDGGAHIDGSDGTDRYGIYINNTTGADADNIMISNVYFHTIYPYLDTASEGHNPTTYMGSGIDAQGQSGNSSENLTVVDCHFEDLGYKCINMSRQNNMSIINNLMENIGGPAMVPNRCDDLLVRGNTVDGSGQYTDPRMHGRGSGIWPINCNRVLIEKNKFMHARGRYDSCGVHLDIGNTDAVVQYNLSMDNEGGFVEILGVNSNCTYRYNISVNDGERRAGVNENGLPVGDGHVIIFSGHNFSGLEREGPYNSYVYNNTIFVKEEQLCSFSIEQTTWGAMVANNIFFVEGDSEDESPLWRGAYPAGMPESIVWINNLYQKGRIFPETWIFTEGNPLYGNPNLANPGGLSDSDYIPSTGAFVEGRGIVVSNIPGDAIGLLNGLAVSEDYFGNAILGLPDIGAVEVGGSVSTVAGSAFYNLPELTDNHTVEMSAVPGPAGYEYYFEELTGNYGGTDSGWQTGTSYIDTGLLPNTEYAYDVIVRDAADVSGNTSVVKTVTSPALLPFPEADLLYEDFALNPNPDNTLSPFPANTWYLDESDPDKSENQTSSVQMANGRMQLGYGYDAVMLQWFSTDTWCLDCDYTFSGDWVIDNVFSNSHVGCVVGFAEHVPSTGTVIRWIKQITTGETGSPYIGQSGSFSLTVSAAELQSAGVSASNRVGIFIEHWGGGSSNKNDVYGFNNLAIVLSGDGVDSDGDGIPNGAESAVGLNPNDPADGTGDLDNDGTSNAAEYLIGTSLNTPNDVLDVRITATSGVPEIVVGESHILPSRVYILEHKSSLMTADPWRAVDSASGTASVGNGDLYITCPYAEDESFFRLRLEWE